jgi:hypothetical protein
MSLRAIFCFASCCAVSLATGCGQSRGAQSRTLTDMFVIGGPSTDAAAKLGDGGTGEQADLGSSDLAGPSAPDMAGAADLAPPDPNDPFPTPSCSGTPATLAQLAALFQPGATEADFSRYTIDGRQRTCNGVTGCSAWSSWTPNFADPTGTVTSAVVEIPRLMVVGSGIQLQLVHRFCQATNTYPGEWYGATCSGLGSATVTCPGYYYVESQQWGGSGGTFCDEGELYLNADSYTLSGIVTPSCFEVKAQAGPSTGTQYAIDVHGSL